MKIYNLYGTLHSAGVAHNNLDMRHILLGGDGRFCLISFENSYYDVPDSSWGHKYRLRKALVDEKRRLLIELGWYDPDGSPSADCPGGITWPASTGHPDAGSESSLSTLSGSLL